MSATVPNHEKGQRTRRAKRIQQLAAMGYSIRRIHWNTGYSHEEIASALGPKPAKRVHVRTMSLAERTRLELLAEVPDYWQGTEADWRRVVEANFGAA